LLELTEFPEGDRAEHGSGSGEYHRRSVDLKSPGKGTITFLRQLKFGPADIDMTMNRINMPGHGLSGIMGPFRAQRTVFCQRA
jgi:hypothetical protein